MQSQYHLIQPSYEPRNLSHLSDSSNLNLSSVSASSVKDSTSILANVDSCASKYDMTDCVESRPNRSNLAMILDSPTEVPPPAILSCNILVCAEILAIRVYNDARKLMVSPQIV